MHITLVSISCLTQAGCHAVFDRSTCQIFNAHKKPLGEVNVANGLYHTQHAYQVLSIAAARGDEQLTMKELHICLSHISVPTICDMMAKGMISGVTLHPDHTEMGQCIACEYDKAARKPIGTIHEPNCTAALGNEVHTDVWDLSPVQTPGKRSYYCSFTDDHTHYTCISLLFVKSNTFSVYLEFESWLKIQHGTSIKWLHSNCGGEYLSNEFSCHLNHSGMERKLTTHDTPQHNGIAE